MSKSPGSDDGVRRRMKRVSSAYALPGAYFTVLSLLVFVPLLDPGFVLTLDMIFAPNTDYLQFGLHTKGPLYYGRIPFLLALDALALFFDDWIIQKLVLVSLPVVSGLSMYAAYESQRESTVSESRSSEAKQYLIGESPRSFTASKSRATLPALFAGTLYAINPFVYVRVLAGHWYFLLGYAFVPLAVVAFDHYVDSNRDDGLVRAVGWTTVVSVFDPHATVLVAVAGCCLWGVKVVPLVRSETSADSKADARESVRRFGSFCLVVAAANAYWLLPALVTAVGGGTHLSTISGADLTVFSARGTVAGNVPLSVAMLYGFWRGAATTTFDVLPLWFVGAIFAGFVYLTVYGALHNWSESSVRGLVLTSVFGFVLSLGVSTTVTEPLVRALVDFVPILRGMRDSQKFVGLLVLTYAMLGARGVDALVLPRILSISKSLDVSRFALPVLASRFAPPALASRFAPLTVASRLVPLALAFLLVLSPLVYTAPMVGGFDDQLDTTTYPESWHEANDQLGDGPGRVLFLPWHQYLTFSWTERRIATPAELFFDRRVIEGHNIEVGGIETRATDPTRTRVREVLQSATDTSHSTTDPSLGDQLASVGIEYVVLAHEADYQRYERISSHPDFTVAFDGEGLTVYENEAFDEASTAWPRAGPPIPSLALGVGCLVSLGAIGVLAHRARSGQ
ncbi:hypothetical protein ACH9L7_14255 [Haloferax sp. S1W]|uniref:hypothetical protein n=1 Tax=Haloferax sp. S1W TaxID=3377110 RepID=UPI0037CC0795